METEKDEVVRHLNWLGLTLTGSFALGIGVFIGWHLALTSSPCFLPRNPPSSFSVEFGHPMKLNYFNIDPDIVFINHGSYGATPLPVLEAEQAYIMEAERNSLQWFETVDSRMEQVQRQMASYVDAEPEDLVLVASASDAVNAVLRSILKAGDKILVNRWTYGMTIRTLEFLNEKQQMGLEIISLDLSLPTTSDTLVEIYTQTLSQITDIKLVIIDHISSGPALIFPLKQLQDLCRSRGITLLTDGAHSVGQIPLSMRQLDPDLYISNVHKWLCGSKGSAFLYARREYHSVLHPTIISHHYNQGFSKEFHWTATRSYAAHLSISQALSFRSSLGDQQVFSYNNALCSSAASALVKRWNTDIPVPNEMYASLVMIRVPCNLLDAELCYDWSPAEVASQLEAVGLWAWGNYVTDGGSVTRYARLSCQIYNELSDYERVFDAFDQITGTLPENYGKDSHAWNVL
eukprot:Lithocolla_globosa_v1_NODE_3749_length_1592_cov_7.818478.p1 type:complete len:461 gc:universal NODE_3749_length_1592_cov_7.818478:1478-96(-)